MTLTDNEYDFDLSFVNDKNETTTIFIKATVADLVAFAKRFKIDGANQNGVELIPSSANGFMNDPFDGWTLDEKRLYDPEYEE